MRAKHWIIAAAAWLTLSAGVSMRECQAGFLGAGDAVQWLSEAGGSSAVPAEDRAAQVPLDPSVELTVSEVQPALSQGTMSSTMTGGGTSVTAGGAAIAALSDGVPSLAMPPAERLVVAESSLIPAVYLSRVFRPPRF